MRAIETKDRPAAGGLHFGYIVPSKVLPVGSEPIWYVLENGQVFEGGDFLPYKRSETDYLSPEIKTYHDTFTLDQDFFPGVTSPAPTAIRISSDFSCVTYSVAASYFPASVQSLLSECQPAGYGAMPSQFTVVMDRNLARIYAYVSAFDAYVPVLWMNKYNRAVRFKWAYVPSGGSNVHTLEVKNHAGAGVHLEWPNLVASDTTEMDLLRMDFIGMSGPGLRVKGFPGTSSRRTALLGDPPPDIDGGVCGMSRYYRKIEPGMPGAVGRPTLVTVGSESLLSRPNWSTYTPANLSDGVVPDARAQWQFVWGDNGHSVLQSMTDPKGLIHSFTYGNVNYGDPAYPQNTDGTRAMSAAFIGVTNYTAQGPSGETRTRTWSRTYERNVAGIDTVCHVVIKEGFGSGTVTRELDLGYESGDPQVKGNSSLTSKTLYQVVNGVRTVLASGVLDLEAWGLDGSYDLTKTSTITKQGELSGTLTINRAKEEQPVPDSTTTSAGAFGKTLANTFASVRDKLEPYRLISSKQVFSGLGGLNAADIYQVLDYGPKGQVLAKKQATNLAATGEWAGTVMTYDAFGRPATTYPATQATGPSKSVSLVTNEYDAAKGLLIRTTTSYAKPIGSDTKESIETTQEAFDNAWRVSVSRDAKKVKSTALYDVLGRPVLVTKDGEADIRYTYDPDFRTTTTTQNGLTTTTVVDAFGRKKLETAPDGTSVEYLYDTYGRLWKTIPKSKAGVQRNPTITAYDDLDRPTRIEAPTYNKDTNTYSNIVKTFTYSVQVAPGTSTQYNAVMETTTAAFSKPGVPSVTTTVTYKDPFGHVMHLKDAKGNLTSYTYDSNGNVETIKRTGEDIRRVFRDGLGRITQKVDPETGTILNSGFNDLGLPTSIQELGQNGASRTRRLSYDGLGRTTRLESGADNNVFTWTYVGMDLKEGISTYGNGEAAIKSSYLYEQPGHRLSKEVTEGDGASMTTEYTYDAVGRLTQVLYPSGRKVGYGYDSLSRISMVSNNGTPLVTSVGYDDWGLQQGTTFASSSMDRWSRDPQGLQVGAWEVRGASSCYSRLDYTFDGLGRPYKAGEWDLRHDELNRVTTANFAPAAGSGYSSFNTGLEYDARDNSVSQTVTGTVPATMGNFSVTVPGTNRMPAVASNSALTGWAYDGWGEATQIGLSLGASQVMSLGWDGFGRLNRAVTPNLTQVYGYDLNGYRFFLKDGTNSANNRKYAYTSTGLLLTDYREATPGANGAAVSAPATPAFSVTSPAPADPSTGVKAAIASPGGSGNANLGATVAFQGTFTLGSAPLQLVGTPSFTWTFGDGGTGSGSSVSHAFNTLGTFNVTMTVTYGYQPTGVIVPPGGTIPVTTGTLTKTLTVRVLPQIKSFQASTGNLAYPGRPVTLSWNATGASSLTLNGQNVTGTNLVVYPLVSTTYALSANGAGGSSSTSLTVNVTPAGAITPVRDVIYMGSRAIAEIEHSGAVHELHTDHQGTPRFVTNGSTGLVEGRQAFGAYGESLPNSLSDSTYKPLIGYTGHLQVDSTGLVYMKGRYYSPYWHRFVSSDHGVDPKSLNQMAYVCGSPFMQTDPTGMVVAANQSPDMSADTSSQAAEINGSYVHGTAGTEALNDLFDFNNQWQETNNPFGLEPAELAKVLESAQIAVLTDDQGNVRFCPTGMGKAEYSGIDGLKVSWTKFVGYVYATDGTAVRASMACGEMTAKGDGSLPSGSDNTSNCIGSAFAGGQVWIEPTEVPSLLLHSGFKETYFPVEGDVGVYSGKRGDPQHAVLATSTGGTTVYSKGGILPGGFVPSGTGSGSAWPDANAKLQWFSR